MDRRGLIAVGAAAGSFLLLAWVAASDQVTMWEESDGGGRGEPLSTPPARPIPVEPSNTLPETIQNDSEPLDLSFLKSVLIVLMGAVALYLLIRAALTVRRLWLRRSRIADRPIAIDFDVLPDIAETLATATADSHELLRHGSPRNAIVRCWVSLCEAVEDAGLQPDPAETSSELTARVLGEYAVDPRAITVLAGLYREARFSEHDITEADRQRAIDALDALDDQLRSRESTETSAP